MDQPKTNFCPYCRAKRSGNEKFCSNCGKELPLLDYEKDLLNKFGTDKKPEMFESAIGIFTNPAKTFERLYYSENQWQTAFFWVVIYGALMGISLFIIMTKTSFSIVGSDPNLVGYFTQNILYFKIAMAFFEGFIAIMEWLIYVALFYLLFLLMKMKIKFSKIAIIAEYACIVLFFVGLLNILTAIFIPAIETTLNVDTFMFDFGDKLNIILTTNLLFIIFSYAEYPFYLYFCFLIGIGLFQDENVENIHAILSIICVFIILKIVLPVALQLAGFII